MIRKINFLLALLLLPLCLMGSGGSLVLNGWLPGASGAWVQQSSGGNLVFTNGSASIIRQSTIDNTDNKAIQLEGGGGTGATRGAEVFARGNEFSGAGGRLSLSTGSTSGADLQLDVESSNGSIAFMTNGGTTRWSVNSSGQISQDGTNGSDIVFAKTLTGVSGLGKLALERTITAGGTTGAQTINKIAGTVNFAAGASSIVVTDSQVTTSSIIFPVIRTADATLTSIKSVVPASGSFTITGNANATAETSVGFIVTN